MDKELFAKLFSDECFRNFCAMADELRKREYQIRIPLETVSLLLAAKVGYIKGNESVEIIHNRIKAFLDPSNHRISRTTSFYDYFVITGMMRAVDENAERLGNVYRMLPLDLTGYAKSICNFDICTCGYKPKVIFSKFINCLDGKVVCRKCGLLVCKLFTHEADIFHGDSGTVYVNLQDGIKELCKQWNAEVAKNESILHRTMRELLSYGSDVCVNPIISDLHKKLYGYMISNGIYRKPAYWNEPGYWDVATNKMMECAEPVQWVEDYLWESLPCRISG